jgi:hypothetical protein
MKTLLSLAAALLLSGCAVKRHIVAWATETPQHEACRVAHYCGPDAGMILVGSAVCYTNHLSDDKPGSPWPKDMVCR